jgi:hypothetical protein
MKEWPNNIPDGWILTLKRKDGDIYKECPFFADKKDGLTIEQIQELAVRAFEIVNYKQD